MKVVCSHGIIYNLWTARSHLVPTKDCLMPRLELLVLSDLMAMVKNSAGGELKIERIYCWSDSLAALFWVKSRNELWKAWGPRWVKRN